MADKEILIERGKLFTMVVRWETEPIIRKAITAISLASGAPRLTIASHGITDGWMGEVYGVEGMKPINEVGEQPLTVIDPNTIELNKVMPVDDNGKLWPAYTSGGFVQFNTPKDITSYTPVIDFKDKVGGTVWLSSQASNDPLDVITATADNATKTITLRIPATDTEAIPMTIKKGIAELEMHHTSDTSDVVKLKMFKDGNEYDSVRVTGEVTT
jgi:hypothetical protein